MSGNITDLLSRYGYLFIAVFLFVESIGIPIPGETALVTAAALAGGGKMSIIGVFLAASLGTITGGMTGYWMGVRGGHAIINRFGRLLRLDDQRLERARIFFERHGASALIVGRFVAVVRSFLGIFAGVSAMPRQKFVLYNALGGLIWSLAFSAIGYFFGRNIPALMHDLGRVSLVLAIVVALVILLVVMWRWFSANGPRLVAVMEARWKRLDARPWVVELRERHPTVWRIVIFRFARGEYLAIHLAVGWLISLAALGVFAAITEDVVEGAPITRADVVLARRLSSFAAPALLDLLRLVGGVGGPKTIGAIVTVVAILLFLRRHWLTLGGWIGAYAGSVVLDVTLRRIVHRSELPISPELFDQQLTSLQQLTNLPTGHTVAALVALGLIAHLLILKTRSPLARILSVVLILTLLTGIVSARLILGTSYLSIESASVAAGVIWLAACISGIELAKHRRTGMDAEANETL